LNKILLLPVFAVLALGLLYNSAYASTPITGTATKCTSFNACSYTITSSNGNGVASTKGGLSFRLPGEAITTTATQHGIQYALVRGIYHITGKFTAIDANNGKVVTGSTDVYERVYGHSGRGGGNYYSLVSGTITFNLTNLDGTSTTVTCNPSTLSSGNTSICTVSVADSARISSVPTGTVTLSASNIGLGAFSHSSCTLSSSSCSVAFKTNQEYGGGTTSIYASYNSDSTHFTSAGRTLLYATASIDNGGD
jgi:hypothetical protein